MTVEIMKSKNSVLKYVSAQINATTNKFKVIHKMCC